MRRRVVLGVGNGIERGLRVARAGQHPREVAGLGPPVALAGIQMRLDQPQEGAPGFHRGAEMIENGHSLDALLVLHRGPALGEDMAGHVPQPLSDRLLRPQTLLSLMRQLYDAFYDTLKKWNLSALSIRESACYISPAVCRTPAARIGAGWSSPVARQAHNLKVVGSNPTPATK